MMIKAFSFESHHVETRFLEYELGIKTERAEKYLFFKPQDKIVLVGSNIKLYLKILFSWKFKKIVFIHLSDEKISFFNLFIYFILPKNVKVYRHYAGFNVSLDYIKRFLIFYWFKEKFNIFFYLNFYFGALSLVKILILNRFLHNIKHLPLGYTNNFIDYIMEQNISIPLSKYEVIKWSDFYGTMGNYNRSMVIKNLKHEFLELHLNNKWNGKDKNVVERYALNLSCSNLSLCLPGFRSNDTFRFYESLYLGSLPIQLPISVNSWLSLKFLPEMYYTFENWNKAIVFFNNYTTKELKDLIISVQREVDRAIKQFKLDINLELETRC